MQILLINLTNEPIDIVKCDTSKVTITPHKPYILESNFRPEINYWTSCTDNRFKIITDQVEVIRYSRVLQNQTKSKQAKLERNKTTDTEPELPTEAMIIKSEPKQEEEVIEETPVDNTYNFTEDSLNTMSVASLKVLANRIEVELPKYAKKPEIIKAILSKEF